MVENHAFLLLGLLPLLNASPVVAQPPQTQTPVIPKFQIITVPKETEIRTLSHLLKRVDKVDPSVVEFMECPDFGVEIRFGSDVPSLKITEADVRAWTAAEIKRSAPRAVIVDTAAQQHRLEEFLSARPGNPLPTTIAGSMALMDSAQRRLHLTVALHEYPEKKVILYLIHLDLTRGAFVPSGLGAPIASQTVRHGVVGEGPAEHPADEIREGIVDLVRDFGERWTRANPPAAPASSPAPKKASSK